MILAKHQKPTAMPCTRLDDFPCAGQIIQFKVVLTLGVPFRSISEITQEHP